MGSDNSTPAGPPPSLPVPVGKIRICMAGLKVSHHAGRAREIAVRLASMRPDLFETWFYYDSDTHFYAFLSQRFANVEFPQHLKGHDTSPFCWIETRKSAESASNDVLPLGGRDRFCEWLLAMYPEVVEAGGKKLKKRVTTGPSLTEAFHNNDDWGMTAAIR